MADSLGEHSFAICIRVHSLHVTLGTAQVQADLCNLSDESKTRQLVLYTSIVFSIALVFVSLRVVGKIVSKRMTPDDWILVLAMLLTAIPCGCMLASKYINHEQR